MAWSGTSLGINVRDRLITIFFSTIVFSLVFYIFKSSLGYDFVWDDREIIVNNVHIRSFSYDNLIWIFTTTFGGNYLPLTWLSFIMDYHVWGLESYGYRLVNIIVHGINSILLMLVTSSFLRLIYRTSANHILIIFSSVVGVLIYALHPLRIESVVWITERKDVLSAFFILISFLAYMNFRFQAAAAITNNSLKRLYAISLCCFFMSLLCKAWAITFPAVLILLDMSTVHSSKLSMNKILESIKQKVPYIIIAALFALIAIFGQNTAGAMITWEKLTLVDRVLQSSYGFNMYLLHTLFPSDLSPLYLLGKTNFYDVKFFAHFLVFLAMFIFTFLIRKKTQWPLYFILIYFVIISPVLGFTQSGAQIMADRYTYIALMPFSIVISCITLRVIELISGLEKYEISVACSIFTAYVFMMSVLVGSTSKQILIWKNEESLWSHAIEIDGLNYQALNNRADYRARKKLYAKSFEDYTLVIEIDAKNAYALNGRAATRIHTGDLKGAVNDLNAALNMLPTYVDALLNRGVAYHNIGDVELARNDFMKIIELLPEHIKANYYLGIGYFSSNEFRKAIILFTNVNKANPTHIDSIYYRGLSYLYTEEYVQAKKDFEHVMINTHKSTALYKNAEQQLDLLNGTDI
jgi:protein O-mannosyl-transferase